MRVTQAAGILFSFLLLANDSSPASIDMEHLLLLKNEDKGQLNLAENNTKPSHQPSIKVEYPPHSQIETGSQLTFLETEVCLI